MIGKADRRILIADYDQEVEVWSETKGVYGQPNVKTKLFTALANIEELSGHKALQYQQKGIGNPVLIEMNWIPELPSYIMWGDNKIPVTSFIDPDNHFKKRVILIGSFIKTSVTSTPIPAPPLELSIIRRLINLDYPDWIDDIANRDVSKIDLPVSSFDGIGSGTSHSSTLAPIIFFNAVIAPTLSANDKCLFIASNVDTIGALRFIITPDQRIQIIGDSVVIATSINTVDPFDKIDVFYSNNFAGNWSFTINNIEDSVGVNPSASVITEDSFIIGSKNLTGDDAYLGLMHTVSVNNIQIPLPHLTYGFDNNGDAVSLVVGDGVSDGLHSKGSTHLNNKGFIRKPTPELVANSDFSNGGVDWIVDGDITFSNNTASYNANGGFIFLNQNIPPLIDGVFYDIEYEILINSLVGSNIGFELSAAGAFGVHVLEKTVGIHRLKVECLNSAATRDIRAYIYNASSGQLVLNYFSITDSIKIIPNNNEGEPIITIEIDDTLISGTEGLKLNTSPTRLELFPPFQIDEEYAFFDTSNILIWKNNFEWNAFDLSQQFINDNIQDDYKDRLFIKIKDGVILDFMLYPETLTPAQLIEMNEYLNA